MIIKMSDRGYGYSRGYYPGGYANYSAFTDYSGYPGHEYNNKLQSKISLSKQEILQIIERNSGRVLNLIKR